MQPGGLQYDAPCNGGSLPLDDGSQSVPQKKKKKKKKNFALKRTSF